jgi:hypothetical protein
MVKYGKTFALWTSDLAAQAFFKDNHLRNMPNSPTGPDIARKLLAMQQHVDTLTVPTSREESLKNAKDAVTKYNGLIEKFQAIVTDANIQTIRKRVGDAIESRYESNVDVKRARKKKLRKAMMVALEHSNDSHVQTVLNAAVRKQNAADLAEDVAVIHNKYNGQDRMDPEEDILSQEA